LTDGKRTRENRIVFHATADEMRLIEQRMHSLGIRNREAFLRKMAIDGYVLKLDLKGIRSLSAQISRMSSNLNQIAKRINSTSRLYEEELTDIRCQQEQISRELRTLLAKIEKFD